MEKGERRLSFADLQRPQPAVALAKVPEDLKPVEVPEDFSQAPNAPEVPAGEDVVTNEKLMETI